MGLPAAPSPPARWAIVLLALLWLLPGLFGTEPWKPDGAYTFGLINHIVATGDWVVPTLAGEPFMEKPPLFFVSAALFHALFSGWWLNDIDAMRLASGFYLGMTFVALVLAARETYGRGMGRWALVVLLGCIGLPVRAHQLITDTALLAGFSVALHGLVLARRRRWLGGLLLGLGVAVTALSKGMLGPGVIGLTALALPMCFAAYRTRAHAQTLCCALLISLPVPLCWMLALYQRDPALFHLWWWDNNLARFLGATDLGPRAAPGSYFKLLPWYALPALPLALLGVWRLAQARLLPQVAAPLLLFLVTLLVLSAAADARELYAMPLLAPLAVLAVAGLQPARAGVRALGRRARAGWLVFAALLISLLLLGALELTVASPVFAPLRMRFFSGWQAHCMPGAWLCAVLVLATVALLWRQSPTAWLTGCVWRWSVLFSTVWALLGVLYLPALDRQMAYRQPFRALAPVLASAQQHDCVASIRLGEPQRALLAYYANTVTRRYESHADAAGACRWLLVQSENGWQSPFLAGRAPVLVVERPGDSKERYLLYALPQPLADLGFQYRQSP